MYNPSIRTLRLKRVSPIEVPYPITFNVVEIVDTAFLMAHKGNLENAKGLFKLEIPKAEDGFYPLNVMTVGPFDEEEGDSLCIITLYNGSNGEEPTSITYPIAGILEIYDEIDT